MKIDAYLSITGLVWCAFFALVMIGVVFFIKRKTTKGNNEINTNIYIYIYIITLILTLLELIMQSVINLGQSKPIIPMIVSKIYIGLGMIWNFTIFIYYMLQIYQKKNKTLDKKFKKKVVTFAVCLIILVLTLIISLPIGYEKHEVGFWQLSGPLNYVYNRMFIICDGLLLVYIIANIKNLSKELVGYSLAIFGLYISNFILESIFGYYAKDSIFLYSLFVAALYYTSESQDKQTSEAYEQARLQTIEIDKQKTNFLLNMSHEIRTPLNTIMGYSDYLLMEERFAKDKIETEGENVYQASETLLSLINNILDVSRIESGKETVIDGDYKLEEIITNIYEKTVPKAALRNNVKFNLEINETLPSNYNGDSAKLERILLSILSNAIEHTTMGEVRLKVDGQRNNDEIEMTFAIRNAGHEMKEDKFNIDFNTITSLETTENIDNNILGIIIAKQLLAIMNGTVEFINKPGQGTQYIIRLKQKCYGQEPIGNVVEKIKKSTEEEIINCEGKVVIVADDNAINLNIAKRLLVKFGFTVDTCLSGQECLDMVRQKKYDMIFLDHMMPGMDGVETLNHLKEEHGNLVPTIALTANASDDSRSEYMNLGFTDYLTKPIDMKELDKILKRLFTN